MKVLVVDDCLPMRTRTRRCLSEIGISDIAFADDGYNALPLLEKQHFDLLIADWDMPGLSGEDLVKHVKRQSGGNDLVILMMFCDATEERIAQAKMAGASGAIEKPFLPQQFRRSVDEICARGRGA